MKEEQGYIRQATPTSGGGFSLIIEIVVGWGAEAKIYLRPDQVERLCEILGASNGTEVQGAQVTVHLDADRTIHSICHNGKFLHKDR